MSRYTNIIISHVLALPTFILMCVILSMIIGMPFVPIFLASQYGFIGIVYFGLYLLFWIICAAIILCLSLWYDYNTGDNFNLAMSATIQLVIYATIIAAIGA